METTRARVIAIKKANPELGTPEISAMVGVTKSRVWQIFVDAGIVTPGERRREPRPGESVKPKPRPEIRPHMMPGLTLSLLMGGRAPRAKLAPVRY